MKVTSIILGALATIVAAAPAQVSEEKRNIGSQFGAGIGQFGGVGQFGNQFGVGGIDAFSLTGAFGFNPIVGFQNNAAGVVFSNDIAVGAFNNFVFQNSFIQYIVGFNQLSFDPIFSLFDAGLGVNNFAALFQHPAGDFLNIQAILALQQFTDLSWIVNQIGANAFLGGFGGFGGFNGQVAPLFSPGNLFDVGLNFNTQVLIQSAGIPNIDSFNNVITGFNGVGLQQFQNFQFQKLAGIGGVGGFGGVSGFLKE